MKIQYERGNHCFYWGQNGFWIIEEEEIQKFKKMAYEWKCEDDTPVDYEFCYVEILDWFKMCDWKKLPIKRKEKILIYLARQA